MVFKNIVLGLQTSLCLEAYCFHFKWAGLLKCKGYECWGCFLKVFSTVVIYIKIRCILSTRESHIPHQLQ